MTAMLPLALILVAYPLATLSATVHYNFKVSNQFIQPDGFNRSSVLVNGKYPGPLIKANRGDVLKVNVENRLFNKSMPVPTSILNVPLFPATLMNTASRQLHNQEPTGIIVIITISIVMVFGSMPLVFTAIGTLINSFSGPIVIYDPHDPHKGLYDVDDESTVVTVGDSYHLPSPQTLVQLEAPEATVVNGLGRQVNDSKGPIAVVNVQKGKRYRFRLVNVACIPEYTVSIDGHKMNVIEADGQAIQPKLVNSVVISPGQRYSVVVNANQAVGNYWFRFAPNFGYPDALDFANGINSAIFRYSGAPDADPTTTLNAGTILRDTDIKPLDSPGSTGSHPADKKLSFNITQGAGPFGNYSVNGKQYIPPSVPVLLQILNGAEPRKLLPEGSVYTLPRNKVVELTVFGQGTLPHPFHLHGHAFDVVKTADSDTFNYVDPPRRDVITTGLPPNATVIRFRTDNPGPWLFHCHIDFHLQVGLAVVFAEDPATLALERPPKVWSELCPTYDAALKAGSLDR